MKTIILESNVNLKLLANRITEQITDIDELVEFVKAIDVGASSWVLACKLSTYFKESCKS